jgi:hypothetical protein
MKRKRAEDEMGRKRKEANTGKHSKYRRYVKNKLLNFLLIHRQLEERAAKQLKKGQYVQEGLKNSLHFSPQRTLLCPPAPVTKKKHLSHPNPLAIKHKIRKKENTPPQSIQTKR